MNNSKATLRLNRETLSMLNSMRVAARTYYKKEFDADQAIEMLVRSVSAANPALWELYREVEKRKQQMASSTIARDIQERYSTRNADL